MDGQQELPYRGAPFPTKWRRNHPRSRNGCLTCRTKRKKCDEVKPTCTGCTRSKQDCVWPTPDKNQQADTQLGQFDGVTEDGNCIANSNQQPVFNLKDSSAPATLVIPQATDTPSSLSPRAALTYGNLAYLSDDSRPLYQQYLDFTAEMLTRGPCLDGNPFINYLLPLAAKDQLVLDCVLAIAGAHLTVNDTTITGRGLEVVTRSHFARVLAGLQKLLSYDTGKLIPATDTQTRSTRSSQVLLILQLLCIYDHMQGTTRGAIYHHLKASREYITLLASAPQSNNELEYMRGFILELYAYHAIKLAISPRNMNSEQTVEIDPSVHSLNVLDGYKTRGCLLGFGQRLFEMIPEISQLVEARREEELLDPNMPSALQTQYECIIARLQAFDPYQENFDSLGPRQERAGATIIYQNALMVYLHSAFHVDLLADPGMEAEIETRIDKVMPFFYALFVGESPYRRMLLWPGVIMASCSRRQEHIHVFRRGLIGKATRTPGAVKTGAHLVELLWSDPDPRAFGPRGLSYIMTKHDISLGLC
ncbi:uncharacterized protein FTOL_02582 [Fusarium torulosum]|uniref:Zn(2)-C6 fungal-type domain-containing protein n=1 Tax=Fusarium torulosum TaxID=33205 RepID=A0AAE8SEI9_9HYPO|nr:uncharacterized protein FTOL_02582 [Fusarium torulosum]